MYRPPSTRSVLFCVLVALLLAVRPAHAQRGATLELTLVAAETGLPLQGAQVSLSMLGLGAVTDAAGRVRLTGIPAGPQIVEMGMVGYRRERMLVDFPAGRRVEGERALEIEPIVLEGVGVVAEARSRTLEDRGFYGRREMGGGTFLDTEYVEELANTGADFIDMMRRVRGFRVVRLPDGSEFIVSSRGMTSLRDSDHTIGGCEPSVFLNGQRFVGGTPWLKTDLPLMQVAAVEVYPGISAPMQYTGTGGCGVLLIWTRMGDEP